MLKQVLDIVFSPITMVGRGVWTIIAILYLTGVIKMGMIDVTNYGVPEEYLVVMLLAAIVMSLLTAIGIRRYFHDKAADKMIEAGEIKTVFDLPYDKRYDFGTAVGFLAGTAGGMWVSPALVDYFFIGAGQWTFVLCTIIGAFFIVVIATTMIHFGLRKWLINAKKYAQETSAQIKDTVEGVKDAVDGVVSEAPATENTPQTIQARKG